MGVIHTLVFTIISLISCSSLINSFELLKSLPSFEWGFKKEEVEINVEFS